MFPGIAGRPAAGRSAPRRPAVAARGAEALGADRRKPFASATRREAVLSTARTSRTLAQAEPAVLDVDEAVPGGEPGRLGHHAAAARVGVRPVADLALPAWPARSMIETSAEAGRRSRVGDRPVHPRSRAAAPRPVAQERSRRGSRVYGAGSAAPSQYARPLVVERLHDPGTSSGRVRRAAPRRRLVIRGRSSQRSAGHSLVARSVPDPGVDHLAALRQPAASVPSQVKPSARPPAARPSCRRWPPDHGLAGRDRPRIRREAPLQQQTQRPLDDAACRGPRGATRRRSRRDRRPRCAGSPCRRRVPAVRRSIAKPHSWSVVPAAGHGLADEPLGVVPGVGHRHGGPGMLSGSRHCSQDPRRRPRCAPAG